MSDFAATLRIFEPSPGVYAYYDGRVPGRRLHGAAPNWRDEAFVLGIAAYAIVDGDDALVFDSHISLDHAARMRAHVESLGARRIRLVLSHCHDDHVAGNAVFADGEIFAHELTATRLAANRATLESADPPIKPLVLPDRTYRDDLSLTVGGRSVRLVHFEIHSADSTVLLLPDAGLMLAGDVVEDTVTYLSEPERTSVHIAELARLAGLSFDRVLPAHGAPEVIAAGGYDRSLVTATAGYLRRLIAAIDDTALATLSLSDFVAADLAAGRVAYYAPYEAVHRRNVAHLAAALRPSDDGSGPEPSHPLSDR